jgi:outer membrane protein assembly factor BamB
MMKKLLLAGAVAIAALSGNSLKAEDAPAAVVKPPRMLVASVDKNAAFILSPDNKIEWECRMPGGCQEAWLLPNGNVLLTGMSAVREVTKDKKVVWEYKSPAGVKTEIHTCQPLPNGNALIGEGGTSRLLEVDGKGAIVKEIKLELKGNAHSHTREVRMREDGTFTVTAMGESAIIDYDKDAKPVWRLDGAEMAKQGVRWAAVHSFIRLPNGNTLVAGGHAPNLAEVTKDKKVIWQFSSADAPELGLTYTAGFQLLPDGKTIIISAYDSKTKIYAINKETKKVLWTITNPEIGRPTHIMVLDGIDNSKPWNLLR